MEQAPADARRSPLPSPSPLWLSAVYKAHGSATSSPNAAARETKPRNKVKRCEQGEPQSHPNPESESAQWGA